MPKVPQSEYGWTPATDADKTQVADELERVIRHPLFQRSGRYASLLRHVVEKTLSGESGALKERLIGVDVFHRTANYDTNEDPVVRFCAGEVRKRLAQYYRNAPDDPIEIGLPVGSYIPLFRLQTSVAEQPSSSEAVGLADSATPEMADTVPEAMALHTDPLQVESRPNLLKFWALAAVALVVCLGLVLRSSMHTDPIMAVWGGHLNKGVSVQICTGNPPAEDGSTADSSDVSIEEHYMQARDRVSLATAGAIADISGFLAANKQPFELSEAATNSLDNLRNRPLVLVNANNNKWTLFLLQPLRFHFSESKDNNVGYIVDTEHPNQLDWKVDFNKPYLSQSEDYAILARFYNKTINAPVLVAAGIGSNGTKAAGEFSVSPHYLADLAQGAPRGWEKMNFEVVLKVEVIQGRMGAIQVVSRNFW